MCQIQSNVIPTATTMPRTMRTMKAIRSVLCTLLSSLDGSICGGQSEDREEGVVPEGGVVPEEGEEPWLKAAGGGEGRGGEGRGEEKRGGEGRKGEGRER